MMNWLGKTWGSWGGNPTSQPVNPEIDPYDKRRSSATIDFYGERSIQDQLRAEEFTPLSGNNQGFFKCTDFWSKADRFWEGAKPKLGLASNLLGTIGDTTGLAKVFSRIPGAPAETSTNLLIGTGITVGVITLCEALVEYAANLNHNSQTSHDDERQEQNESNLLRALSLLISTGAWAGYSIGATISAILALDKRFQYKPADIAVTLCNALIIGFGFVTTYADRRRMYKNLNYVLELTSEKGDEEADIWTIINPLSNLAMIYGHTIFYRDIFIALIAIFSPGFSAGVSAYWLTMVLGALVGGLPAVILTYCDFIQNKNLQDDKPTVDMHDVELNTTGKILAGFCRFHYATESGAPGVLGLEKILGGMMTPGTKIGTYFLSQLLSLILTAADTDTLKEELKPHFPVDSSRLVLN